MSFSVNRHIHLKLEITLAIPASNEQDHLPPQEATLCQDLNE